MLCASRMHQHSQCHSANTPVFARYGATASSYSVCIGSSDSPFTFLKAAWLSTAGCSFASKFAESHK